MATSVRALYGARDTIRDHGENKSLTEEPYRTEYRRDYARLIHSASFRRLQGKTQLFPGLDSDFFRNRLTHSLEVAQVAKGLALKFNHSDPFLKDHPIDLDLMEFAGLAHDLGHPPFGHNGEEALDECMRLAGGFEGNAQTLRILSRLEKKIDVTAGAGLGATDRRVGLNLSYRTLAAILKYDHSIPTERGEGKPEKGYYASEAGLVQRIRDAIIPYEKSARLKTIECEIMDIADDIAYSTYDLEDALKAQFISPLDMISGDQKLLEQVAKRCNDGFAKREYNLKITSSEVQRVLVSIVQSQGFFDTKDLKTSDGPLGPELLSKVVSKLHNNSTRIQSSGYERTQLTSHLVGRFISGVEFSLDEKNPCLSGVAIKPETLWEIEVLKNFTFEKLIMSPRLRLLRYRGMEIVRRIFAALADEKSRGFQLLPDDCRDLYESTSDPVMRKRVICDFIAGMTDQYASEYFARLSSENPRTVFKPY